MKLGLIGAGNMASAILGGVLNTGKIMPEHIRMSDRDAAKLREKEALGIHVSEDNKTVVRESDICIFAVKPQVLPAVLREISDLPCEDTLFVSIVAGIPMASIEEMLGKSVKLIRVMPNTPLLVGEGMSVLAPNERVSDEELRAVEGLFAASGKTAVLSERLFDTVTAASGSSPAYVFMMIDAMADAALRGGIARADAVTLCAQAVLGSAKMVLETGMHPAALKDMVCSPGGTTIEAVAALEECGFRSALITAMEACEEKSKELGK